MNPSSNPIVYHDLGLRHVKLAPGAEPGRWSIVTAFLGNPVGDAVLRGMAALPEGATTTNLAQREAERLARRVERYIEGQEE